MCNANSVILWPTYARTFPHGHWSFLGPGSEKKKCGTVTYKPNGKWDKDTELMMMNFSESGHPVFRGTSAVERGTLKGKGGKKLSFHFCDDGDTIETVFRTMISVNQLSFYGAVANMCEKLACTTDSLTSVHAQLDRTGLESIDIKKSSHIVILCSCMVAEPVH